MPAPDRRTALGRVIAGLMLTCFGAPFAWAWVTLRISALHPFALAATLLPVAGVLLGLWLLVDGGLTLVGRTAHEHEQTEPNPLTVSVKQRSRTVGEPEEPRAAESLSRTRQPEGR